MRPVVAGVAHMSWALKRAAACQLGIDTQRGMVTTSSFFVGGLQRGLPLLSIKGVAEEGT